MPHDGVGELSGFTPAPQVGAGVYDFKGTMSDYVYAQHKISVRYSPDNHRYARAVDVTSVVFTGEHSPPAPPADDQGRDRRPRENLVGWLKRLVSRPPPFVRVCGLGVSPGSVGSTRA